MSSFQHPADRYAEAFAQLTPDTLDQLCAIKSDKANFNKRLECRAYNWLVCYFLHRKISMMCPIELE